MRRSKLNTPGGFAAASIYPQPCTLCGAMTAHGWLHVLTSSVVCSEFCLPDPWAEERGSKRVSLDAEPAPKRYAGERVAAQLRAAVGMAS
jgi:hypothetical protein